MRIARATQIAVIEPSGRLYGSEFCLLDILDGVDKRCFDWTVIMPSGNGFDAVLSKRDVRCEYLLPSRADGVSRFRRIGVYFRVISRLRSLAPDLLYINQTGSLRIAALYAKILKLPMVCQVQTLEDARWLSARPKLHTHVNAFVCNSCYIADLTQVDERKKCVLYQGLPQSRMHNAFANAQKPRVHPPGTVFTVGILGRIAVSKGHYLLLDAAKLLVEQDGNFRFVVIGAGLTQKDTDNFQTAVATAGLQQYFEFRGYQSDIESELARIDILAIPSIAEPLGRVLFDAAEFGVPVVVADSGGLGEVSKRFNIGVRFAAENPKALADAIRESASKYDTVLSRFQLAAVDIFRRLPSSPYIETIERILMLSAQRQLVSEVWLGTEPVHSE